MKILGLIPARGGSKGIPNKNIKLLEGKPLIQYTIDVALQSEKLDEVLVSSDSEAIIEIATTLGAKPPFLRPSNLAEDNSTTLSVVRHALNYFSDQGVHYDAVCLLQVTNPFRSLEFLNSAIETFISEKPDALVSVTRIPHSYNPHWAFLVDDTGFLKIATGDETIIPRRQDLPISYYRNGSIYITKASVILEENSLYGNKISYIESPPETTINIDTEVDWEKAKSYIAANQ